MAPRVDRPVVRAPRQVELVAHVRKDGRGDRSATWKDTDIVRPSDAMDASCHSSRVKVQAAGGDRLSQDGPPPASGGRLAQLVRALP